MKKVIFIIVFSIFSLFNICFAEVDYQDILDSYTEDYAKKIEASIEECGAFEYNEFPDFDVRKILKNASSGKELFSIKGLLKKVINIFFSEIGLISKSLVCLLAISMLGAFLLNLKGTFGTDEITTAGYLCIYLLTVGILAAVFMELSDIVLQAVRSLSLFVKGIFPVIIASLYSSGCVSSALVLQPILAASAEICIYLIEKLLVPIVMLSFSVCAVGSLSEKINADKFSAFLMKSVKWILAVMLIVFIGVVGLQSIATSSVDGLSVKLTKFATSNLVPVVGGLLSESVETVMNCSIVIKNSVGILGILAVLYMALMPLIKLWANLIVLRFSAAVMQPISDARIIKCITNTADLISLLLGILASLSVMFILIITIIINTGNSAIMLGK